MMLEALKLSRHYGTHCALHELNLTIPPGDIFCLLGANGAGKSTTLKLFLNFIAPTSGQARIGGLDVTTQSARTRPLLGYVPEQVALYPRLSGFENLRYFASLAGESDLSRTRLVDALMQAGLSADFVNRRAATYSKGMRQKVVVALALVRNSRVLLLDEPTSGLDPQAAADFAELLRHLARQGVAILMTSHDLLHARESSTRIGIMSHGVLVDTFPAAAVSQTELQQRALQGMRARTAMPQLTANPPIQREFCGG